MKRIISGIAIAAAVMLGMTGCADPEASALLTDGAWKFRNITTNSEDDAIKTLVAGIKAFYVDATMEFQDAGDYIIEFALADPETGTWELIGDDQLILTDDEQGVPSTVNIDTLTEDKLSYVQTLVDPQTQTTFTVTFTWDR